MSVNLVSFATSLLAAANLTVNEDGFVSQVTDDGRKPFFVGEKRLVIPNEYQMARTSWDERIAFQPTYENVVQSEPKEMAAYRRALNDYISQVATGVMLVLLEISGSTADHKKLDSSQLDFLRTVSTVTDDTRVTFMKLVKVMMQSTDPQECMLSLYLRKNGKYQGKAVRQLAVTSFPFYKQLVEDGQKREEIMEKRAKQSKENRDPLPENATYGVKLSVNERETFIALLEYIFPNIEVPDFYSAPGVSDYFPLLEALTGAMGKLIGSINDVIDRFSNIRPNLAKIRIEDGWAEVMLDHAALHRAARMQPDQNGSASNADVKPATAPTPASVAPAHAAAPAPMAMAVPAPVMHAPPAPAPQRGGSVKLGEALAAAHQQMPGSYPVQQPGMMAYPGQQMMPVYGQPQQMQQPMYPVQQMQQPMQQSRAMFPVSAPQQQPMQQPGMMMYQQPVTPHGRF